MKSRIFLPSRAQTGFGFRRIAKPRTYFAVCRVRSLTSSNPKESKDWRKSRVSVRALPGRFATSFFTAGLRCSIVSAAKARRLPFLRLCLASGKNLHVDFHDDLGIETLEDLEVAAHDGRVEKYPGIGAKRLAGIRDSLAQRLGRIRRRTTSTPPPRVPSVSELLDVDLEYREKAKAGTLTQIAPRRFNPEGESWLPILHTVRNGRHYTALFSNTARAHELDKTRDWVVLFCDNGDTEHRFTVITSRVRPIEGQRIVAGREAECEKYYQRASTSLPD